MAVVSMYVMPHAPVFIDEIGGNQTDDVRNTIIALNDIGKKIANQDPDVLVIISPHGPMFSDAIAVYDLDTYDGDFGLFGFADLKESYIKDQAFIDKLITLSKQEGFRYYPLKGNEFEKFQFKASLDHGVTVPLHFISKYLKSPQIVAMSFGTMAYTELIESGLLINEVAKILDKRTVIIASGDQSHALKNSGPYRKHISGQRFDEKMVNGIKEEAYFKVFVNQDEIEEAKECGLRSYALGIGALLNSQIKSQVLSYEGPFGVGYLCAEFKVFAEDQTVLINQYESFKRYLDKEREQQRKNAHFYVKLAQAAIESYVHLPKKPLVKLSEEEVSINGIKFKLIDKKDLSKKSGVFVSIKDMNGLRGCIGTYIPTKDNILEEIVTNAIAAAASDPRFSPITVDELEDIIVTVDILSKMETVDNVDDLDVERFGIVVTDGVKSGLLLPQIEGIDTVDEQLKVAANKAGLTVDKIKHIERFTVDRYK